MIRSVGIFCGSSKGFNPQFESASAEYASILAHNRIRIIYGAGSTGIMGVVAESALRHNGYIIGVAPGFLIEKEVVHKNLNELHIVEDMFERKALLINLSDAFAILPGGIGTLDEFFEVFTALQLETIEKPVGILNICGYYDKLIDMIHHMVHERFLRAEHFNSLVIESDPMEFHRKLMNHQPEKVESWVDELRKNNKF
jgi:uncharacterized protein (TIGR00730 family)